MYNYGRKSLHACMQELIEPRHLGLALNNTCPMLTQTPRGQRLSPSWKRKRVRNTLGLSPLAESFRVTLPQASRRSAVYPIFHEVFVVLVSPAREEDEQKDRQSQGKGMQVKS